MNRAYRLVWNNRLQQYIPAAETARSRGKRKSLQGASAAVLATLAIAAQAMPTGGQVSAGQGSIARSGEAMTVTQSSQHLSVNWQSFSIAPAESVRFAQPNASAVALNRVLGSDASAIYGRLQANGQVFLVNPNGILFSRTAQVDVGGLVASTLNLSDADFLAGKRSFAGSGRAVVNEGTINAPGGYVALLGALVSNQGTITARLGTVALAAGNKVTLDFAGDKLLTVTVDEAALNAAVRNSQLIQADGGTVILTAAAQDALLTTVVNNDGVIQARTIENRNGSIWLLGGNAAVQVSGTLDASAPNGGNGGFIETSGAQVKVGDSAVITTAAPYGTTGTWLVDPQDYRIAAAGGDITGTALGTALGGSNVTILSSSSATAGNGDIFVNDNVSWSANTTLTLSALRNVDVNAVIAASGNSAGLTLTPATGGSGSFRLGATGRIDLTGSNPSLSIAGNAYTVINDVIELQNMSADLAGYYALGNDINAAATSGWNGGAGFAPVGTPATPFTGTLDGLNHTVTALTISRPITDDVGLIGFAINSAIANIGLINASITGDFAVGGLAGYLDVGTVRNSYSSGTVSGTSLVGGLVGQGYEVTISNSHSSAAVSGVDTVGGVLGHTQHGTVINSYSTGPVTGTNAVGGLVGSTTTGDIVDSYSTGAVTGTSAIGGLLGSQTLGGSVSGSYSTGAVSGSGSGLGGLVGYSSESSVSDSHSTGSVTGGAESSALGGLIGSNEQASVTDSYSTGAVTGAAEVGATGSQYVGGLIGRNQVTSPVSDSYSTGNVTGVWYVGGLIGQNSHNSPVTNSHSTGNVAGRSLLGGLIGKNTSSTVTNSYATGAISLIAGGVDNYSTGGLIGTNESATVSNSYSTGAVAGMLDAGGLVGFNHLGTVTNSYSTGAVTGYQDTGGLVGRNTGTVTNSHSTGAASNYSRRVGGLVGVNEPTGSVNNSYSTGAVNGSGVVGGLVAINKGTITESYSTGTVTGDSEGVGGLVGYNIATGSITKSYSTGAVTGTYDYVGGLVGNNSGTVMQSYSTSAVNGSTTGDYLGGLIGYNSGSVEETYSAGSVSGSGTYLGGLVGYNNGGTVSRSFWDTQTSGQATSAGGIGMTTAQMKTQANFTSATPANGNVNPNWDFTTVWRMYEGLTYPLLRNFLTAITVTAKSATTTYDGLAYADPAGVNYSIPGATLLGTLAYVDTGTGQPVVDAGTYTIRPSGLWSTQQGYDISYATGTLTINPALLTWSVADAFSVYGTVPVPGSATLTGVVSGDVVTGTVGLFRGRKQFTPSATLGMGAYKEKVIGLTGPDSGNYILSPTGNTTGTLKILPH